MKRWLKISFFILEGLFALIGLLFVGVYIAMQFGLLNVRGSIAERNAFFTSLGFPSSSTASSSPACVAEAQKTCAWNATPEWQVISGGLVKDKDIILQVSQKTGVSARMLATVVVPEQTRFFTSNREVFKSYFEPLKILGSLSQFSLGVSGIKEETAKKIELYANDPTSRFYPGAGFAELIAYPAGVDQNTELYNRLTDAKNHYYSYLYTAIYIKEIESQWKLDGFDISQNGGVVATIFNIGFQGSLPKADPKMGGAWIATGGKNYTYGELGDMFYHSAELVNIFPL